MTKKAYFCILTMLLSLLSLWKRYDNFPFFRPSILMIWRSGCMPFPIGAKYFAKARSLCVKTSHADLSIALPEGARAWRWVKRDAD